MTKIPERAEKAWNFLKNKAFSQSKSDKNSDKGRENMKNKGKTGLFLSPNVTKIPTRAEKAWNFLKDKAFSQSKSDKNSGKGRESKEFIENQCFFSV